MTTLSLIRESPLVEIATVAEAMPGSIKLCYGETDAPTPDFISRAVYDAARHGHTFYTHTAGYSALREAIATKVAALHGVSYRPSEIMATVGASMAIYVAIRASVGPGDNAVIVSPAYAIYANAVLMAGGRPRPVPLQPTVAGFALDVNAVARAMDARTKMLIVNSPSNPTGWMATPAEQRALYELAERRDIVLLADEVYERLVFDSPLAPSFAQLTGGPTDHLIVVNSFSKTYSMTGWRLGWAQATERMIRTMYSAAEFMTSNPTAAVQQAGIVALRDGDEYVASLRASYAARRDLVIDALRTMPGVTPVVPAGAFYVFARVDGVNDSAVYARELLNRTGVAVAPGSAFGDGGEGYVRLCFAASERVLTDALQRLAAP